ncbi:diguanylate cyclase (GGDEF)-like protein [Rhodoferax ferrireducens]|uniref:diguanylate cyclase n=1 Tax=Rhodoferax ferrireducens TaxID=192843 RepID=A0ABU2C759_9BURK|nr:sensor domain-containing diguanylate cyclase [Rhodoferax ferrireducens]MDR7377171.1 diguanylate cyclase (GGDEF)-like protein [Rhodoferax ferrireducens]
MPFNSMPEALHNTLATGPQKSLAALLALIVVLATLLAVPYAGLPLPVVQPFLPIFAATVTLTESLTAYLLLVQFMVTRQFFLVPLAGGYAYVALMASIQLLVFPGVFAPTGLLGANTQSAVWLWVFWHGGFAVLLGLAILAKNASWHAELSRRITAWQGLLVFLLVPLVALALAFLAIRLEVLPVLISGKSFSSLSHSAVGWVVWGLNAAAVLLILLTRSRREVTSLFLFIALLAALANVSLTLLSSARYSLGWYAARLLSIVSSTSLLTALILQITRLYQELAVSHESLLITSARDKLTGLHNRGSFDEAAKKEWPRAHRSAEPLSVVLVDIDHFKLYNDHFGHLQGDTCLRSVAQALAGSVKRPADMVARYGGEEFVLLLPNTPQEQALRVAEKARLAVAALYIPTKFADKNVSISAGCATWHAQANYQNFQELLHDADRALYKAKENGRNQVRAVG